METSPVIADTIVEPGKPWGFRLSRGQHLRIVDLEGKQAVDFLCYDANNIRDRYNAANTIKIGGKVFLDKGSKLISDEAKTLMSVAEDTCGRHDTIAGCCSGPMNLLRYGQKGEYNCRDTFIEILKQYGMNEADIVSNINFFMYVPVQPDGQVAISEGLSRPGDYVDLVAEMDVIVVVSNCAQKFNSCNNFNPSPVRIIVHQPQTDGEGRG